MHLIKIELHEEAPGSRDCSCKYFSVYLFCNHLLDICMLYFYVCGSDGVLLTGKHIQCLFLTFMYVLISQITFLKVVNCYECEINKSITCLHKISREGDMGFP